MFFYKMWDDKGVPYVARDSLHMLYKQQTSQTLGESCNGVSVLMNHAVENYPWAEELDLISDNCNNLHNHALIPHILAGNERGWILKEGPTVLPRPKAPEKETTPKSNAAARPIYRLTHTHGMYCHCLPFCNCYTVSHIR